MNQEKLIKKSNLQKIAHEGAKIYEKIRVNYEPKDIGKFLAIDIDSKKPYLAVTSAEAVQMARRSHPNKVFYVVRIGFDAAETIARDLGLQVTGVTKTRIANGQVITVPTAQALSSMEGSVKYVQVLISESMPLVGISFLSKFDYTAVIDCKHKTVTLEKTR